MTTLLLFRLTILALSLTKILLKKVFKKKKPLLATRQAKSLQNLLLGERFNIVPEPIAAPKNIGLYNFQHKRLKGVFYIVTIILTLAKNLNINLNVVDTTFGNTTVILTLKEEI